MVVVEVVVVVVVVVLKGNIECGIEWIKRLDIVLFLSVYRI